MTTNRKTQEAYESYRTQMGRVQTGIAMKMQIDGSFEMVCASPKHIRVGIDSAMVSDRALYDLLIQKGLIHEHEYAVALAVAAKREADELERYIQTATGNPNLKLGEAGIHRE